MSKKMNVLIIFGGKSNEYEVSLRSACSVLEHLDLTLFNPVVVGINKQGKWFLYSGNTADIMADKWQETAVEAILSPDAQERCVVAFGANGVERIPIDVIYPAVHGQNCEDGALQGLLKLTGIPFVGCKVMPSAICFDKEITHIVGEYNNIPMAKWIAVRKNQTASEINSLIKASVGYPAFIKPANSGSSVGTAPIKDESELEGALEIAFAQDNKAIIEELVTAQEVECAVYGNEDIIAPTTGEIVSNGGFYDYDSKYLNDTAALYIPANIPPKTQQKVQELAMKIYKAFDCSGLARVDFFVRDKETVIFNEINTLPGFTSISMYPKMMCEKTFSYKELVTGLINLALEDKSR